MLAEYTGNANGEFKEIPPCEFVHCCIDVQREFCDPEHSANRGNTSTVKIAEHIANISPTFREAHIPTFMVYFARDLKEDPARASGGFFKVQPEPTDVLVPKNRDGAFEGSNIADELNSRGIKTLIVSGFNTNACVQDTILGGLRAGFNVWIMSDCIGNDNCNRGDPNSYIQRMVSRGAVVKSHEDALKEANAVINANAQPVIAP